MILRLLAKMISTNYYNLYARAYYESMSAIKKPKYEWYKLCKISFIYQYLNRMRIAVKCVAYYCPIANSFINTYTIIVLERILIFRFGTNNSYFELLRIISIYTHIPKNCLTADIIFPSTYLYCTTSR